MLWKCLVNSIVCEIVRSKKLNLLDGKRVLNTVVGVSAEQFISSLREVRFFLNLSICFYLLVFLREKEGFDRWLGSL